METTLDIKPTWRGRLHTWAFAVAVPLGVTLLMAARHPAARVAVGIYATSLVALFGTSAAYHRLPRTDRSRRILRRLDHSMIYVLIAGTYTPMCLLALPRAWGIPVLCVVWTGAALGIVLKLVAFDRIRRFGSVLYMVLGWTVVAALPVLLRRLTVSEMLLLLAGGLVYTAGALVLTTRRPNPRPKVFGYHEVWHACTVIAGFCHFATIALVVRAG